MNEKRSWNKIWTEPANPGIKIVAERSDYEIFSVKTIEFNFFTIQKVIATLEEFRNCDCTRKGGACILHVTNINTNLIPETIAKNNPYLRKAFRLI
jgi:hypothetical protein